MLDRIKQQYEGRQASDDLKAFMDECHLKAREAGFPYVGRFEMMRHEYGTLVAMALLVCSGDFQDGFIWCRDHNLLDHSVEAGVVQFSEEFMPEHVASAKWRLETVQAT